MIRNYLLTALRSFLKHRTFTFLNVTGLTIGLVASLLILQYVKYEKSYDRFHSRASDIYRVEYDYWQNGKLRFECAAAVPAVGPALKNNFPEVERFTRLFPVNGIISYDSPENGLIAHREEKMQITDSSVFKVFDFKLISGNENEVLRGPGKVVISESAAKRYFGSADPIGKRIKYGSDRNTREVTGVFKDVPMNSHIKFDFLFSYEDLYEGGVNAVDQEAENSWGWYDFNTYVLLRPGTDVKALQAKWDNYVYKTRHESWEKRNVRQAFVLQPMTDIHLYSNLLQESEPEERGDGDSVYALTFIALFILIIAWVNYINLATAKSFDRANEVGVRKAMGAQSSQLMRQFLAESFLVNLFAAVIAMVAVFLLWPVFADLSGRQIPTSYIFSADFWILFAILFVIGTVLSGFYPALVLSRFKPMSVLKGKVTRTSQGNVLRKSLVVFQFSASVVLIVGSIVVFQQLSFMRQQKLGINIAKTLVVKGPGIAADSTFMEKTNSFKAEVLRIAGVKSIASASNVPGDEIFWASGIRKLTAGRDENISGYTVGIDHEYINAYELELVAGRSFEISRPSDTRAVILNRAMLEALDLKDPESAIGQKVIQGDTLEVIGVLENYHQMSLKEAMVPLVFRYSPRFARYYSIKLETEDYKSVLSAIEQPWNALFPGNPIDYFYLDQFFNRQYESDRQFGRIFSLFTALAIFIACLGLFGLASFLTTQRTKEIGIRKVLGSSASNVVLLLSKGFIQLVLIANLIAWPLAWYAMDKWLQNFPYRVKLNPVWFIIAGVGVVLIAFVSVGFQTMRAATINPATTLKHE